MAQGFVDSAFMGRVSPVEFAAVSIGNTWSFLFLAFGLGVLTVLDPIVSQAWGARDLPAISRGMQRGLVLAMGLSVLVGIGDLARRTSSSRRPARTPRSCRSRRSTRGSRSSRRRPSSGSSPCGSRCRPCTSCVLLIFVILFANVVNAGLDWVLIGGRLGFPAWGRRGAPGRR